MMLCLPNASVDAVFSVGLGYEARKGNRNAAVAAAVIDLDGDDDALRKARCRGVLDGQYMKAVTIDMHEARWRVGVLAPDEDAPAAQQDVKCILFAQWLFARVRARLSEYFGWWRQQRSVVAEQLEGLGFVRWC